MNIKKIIFVLSLFLSIFTSCNDEDILNTKTFIVASEQKKCTGVAEQLCYLIKEKETDNWEYFYNTIDGFTYKKGFEYIIKVEITSVKNPPADGSSLTYKLVKIISKKQKNAEL